jgi:D-alanine-D-alanine ligase
MNLRVAVICGGPSAEANVSRTSAAGVAAALESAGHSVTRYELDVHLATRLVSEQPDVVFPITHGTVGEDGCLQGLLEVLNLPYVGCGVLASAIAANKPLAKHLWREQGLPVALDQVVTRGDDTLRAAIQARETLGAALVVKPAQGGSAIGVFRINGEQPLNEIVVGIDSVLRMDEQAIVEPLLGGVEVTCGVLEAVPGSPRAFPPMMIVPQLANFYDFASKYAPGGSRHLCPAPLSQAVNARVQELAVLAHKAVGARDLSRVDFIVDEHTAPPQITLLEINTLPGMTATSLYPESASAFGIGFPALCDGLVKVAYARPRRTMPRAPEIPGGN